MTSVEFPRPLMIQELKTHNDNPSEKKETSLSPKYRITWEPAMARHIHNLVLERRRLDNFNTDVIYDDDDRQPFMVALVGMPGSGKSTSVSLLQHQLAALGLRSTIMPHDGYHYSLNDLKLFPDPQDALYRRGAPDTFDARALKRDLTRIRHGQEPCVLVPGFDHAKGDPEDGQHVFDRRLDDIVLCEGLYLLHSQDGWQDIQDDFDLTIFLNLVDLDECMERVKIRNRCIPGYTPEEIDVRTERVDRVNAETVLKSKDRADIVVEPTTAEVLATMEPPPPSKE